MSKSFWKTCALLLAVSLAAGFVYYSANATALSKQGEPMFHGSKAPFRAANDSLNQ